MSVIVQYTKKAWKSRQKLNASVRAILEALEEDMRATKGKPLGRGWHNLGPVRQYADNAYHCHLTRDIVALWVIVESEDGNIKITVCTVEFVGTRGKAPY